jgi:hypothetical protein
MMWFLKAHELPDGFWTCRFGRERLGTVRDKNAALWLMAEAASELGGRDLFRFYLRHGNGTIESVLGTDVLPGEG